MAAKHSGLGRGFGELFQRTDLDDDDEERIDDASTDGDAINERVGGSRLELISVDEISPNARQPRKTFNEEELTELSESIRAVGVLQPVVVTPADNGYELVMGERRWRAARKAGLATVPAIVRTTASEDMLRDALLENLHRVQLNPLEEAAAYEQMLNDFGCTQDELSLRRSSVPGHRLRTPSGCSNLARTCRNDFLMVRSPLVTLDAFWRLIILRYKSAQRIAS